MSLYKQNKSIPHMFVNTLSFASNGFMSFEGRFYSTSNPSPSTVIPGKGDKCLNLLSEIGEGNMMMWMIRANNIFSSQPEFIQKLLEILPTEPEDFAIVEKFFLGITRKVTKEEVEEKIEHLYSVNKSSFDQGVEAVRGLFSKDTTEEQAVDVGLRLWKGFKNMLFKGSEIAVLTNRLRVMNKNGEDVYNGGKLIDFLVTNERICEDYAERIFEKTNGYFTKKAMAKFLIKLHEIYEELENKL